MKKIRKLKDELSKSDSKRKPRKSKSKKVKKLIPLKRNKNYNQYLEEE